ncbi:hypothetical protein AFM11_05170 [Mycolicibacterium wolinskyi]|uniref:Uncharacterized protein n=1 Tax=Mycolicibacterium wolinskyi TaxID=59750 RepID=A0A132PTH6_9MYCO|nr:hypothetical protein [Mycolicibacterium wolinskyi]KWX25623.1 hypothetical protein AFM11_05170 [Mycolicibacterium wolinskyi]
MNPTKMFPHGPTPRTDAYGLWMPSYCPEGLRQSTDRRHVLVDATRVEWHGGPRCVAHYTCPNCGATWTEDWPVVLSPYADEYRQQRKHRRTAA